MILTANYISLRAESRAPATAIISQTRDVASLIDPFCHYLASASEILSRDEDNEKAYDRSVAALAAAAGWQKQTRVDRSGQSIDHLRKEQLRRELSAWRDQSERDRE